MAGNVPALQLVFWGTGSEWFWAALQFFVIALSLYFIYRQLRIQSFSHIVSALSTIDDQWNSKLMLVARVRTCEKWRKVYLALQKKPQVLKDTSYRLDGNAQAIADFFEDLAIYHSKCVIPRDMIWHAYSWYLEYYWALLQEGITQTKNELKDATLYSLLPKLIEAMKKENIKREAPTFTKTKDEILKFLNMEIDSLAELIENEKRG
jgi:hypothetical protein